LYSPLSAYKNVAGVMVGYIDESQNPKQDMITRIDESQNPRQDMITRKEQSICPEEEYRYSSTLFLTSALDGGGWSTPRPGRHPQFSSLGVSQGIKSRPPTGNAHVTINIYFVLLLHVWREARSQSRH